MRTVTFKSDEDTLPGLVVKKDKVVDLQRRLRAGAKAGIGRPPNTVREAWREAHTA